LCSSVFIESAAVRSTCSSALPMRRSCLVSWQIADDAFHGDQPPSDGRGAPQALGFDVPGVVPIEDVANIGNVRRTQQRVNGVASYSRFRRFSVDVSAWSSESRLNRNAEHCGGTRWRSRAGWDGRAPRERGRRRQSTARLSDCLVVS